MRRCRSPTAAHPGVARRLRDLVRRRAGADRALDLRRDRQHLDDREPAAIAGHRALGAADRLVERRPRGDPRAASPGSLDPDLLARRAEPPHQPLRDDAAERGGDLVRLDADVHEARDRVRGVVGVQRREHQVAGERRLDGDVRRLPVADLADEHDVGVLAEDRAQRAREGEPRLLVHLHLHDALQSQVFGNCGYAGDGCGYIIHLQSHIAVLNDFAVYVRCSGLTGSEAGCGIVGVALELHGLLVPVQVLLL